MERRKFLRLSALSSASALLLNGRKVSAFSKTELFNQIPASIIEGRSLVMIQLLGGNDGLNTLIPLNQYDDYASLRPTLKLKNTGLNAAINLDGTLPLEGQMLLHPSLTGFKTLYDAGKLNVINSVGYPSITRSHFTGRALLLKGGDGTAENANKTSGWMARFLNSGYNYSDYSDPLGIQLGSKKPSLGFHSEHEHKVDVNLTGQDVSGYYSIISNIGNPKPTNISDSEFGENIEFITQTEATTNSYSQRISEVFDNGSNSAVVYPDYDLADQLKTVAKMIKGGSKTKIFLVTAKGFDTHADQVAPNGNSHLGKHADLLTELGDSVVAFQDDLEALGIGEKVVSATFTEFGRKPLENGNYGSDHGNLGPMFVIGSTVKPGVTGTNLDLSSIVKHFDEGQMQHDYRQVFTTLITDFMGASSDVVLGTEFSDFEGDQKLDLIGENHKILSTDTIAVKKQSLTIYPNPVEEVFVLKFESKITFRGQIIIYNMLGAVVFNSPQYFKYGINLLSTIDISSFKEGHYILAIKDGLNITIEKQRLLKK
tara:strand:+ start:25490 stop:27112 length:1623 start_codon:yes stop_codon:yes gene_type:complete